MGNVFKEGTMLAAAGLAIGLVAAMAGAWSLRGMLFEVAPWDTATLVSTIAVLAVVAALACAVPARRAIRTDPADVLRTE
jgi:ABC-type antimicrobial peptide transport system permease subunit